MLDIKSCKTTSHNKVNSEYVSSMNHQIKSELALFSHVIKCNYQMTANPSTVTNNHECSTLYCLVSSTWCNQPTENQETSVF